eukprot:COSAG06_NODE_2045_length_7751_cov_1.725039_1_plen_216_part_10
MLLLLLLLLLSLCDDLLHCRIAIHSPPLHALCKDHRLICNRTDAMKTNDLSERDFLRWAAFPTAAVAIRGSDVVHAILLLVLLGYEPAEVTAEYVNGIFDEFSSDPPPSAAGGERGIRPEEFVRLWKFLRGEGDGSEGDGGAAGGGGGGGGGGEQADAEGTADSSPAPDGPSAQGDDDGAEEEDEEDEDEDGMYYITAPDGDGSGGEGSPSEEVSF